MNQTSGDNVANNKRQKRRAIDPSVNYVAATQTPFAAQASHLVLEYLMPVI